MSKLQSGLYNIFLFLFIPVLLILSLIFLGNISEPKYIYYPLLLIGIFAILLFILKKLSITLSDKVFFIIIALSGLLLFLFQYSIFKSSPELILYGDVKAMYSGFREISSYGELTGYEEYFLAHPHQLFTALFYGILNRIFVILGFTAPVYVKGTIITNCLLIISGGILLSLAVKHVADNTYGIFTMFMFCLFNSYWGCILYAYTHTLSVFFLCLAIFCFAYFVKSEKPVSRFIWLIISGIGFALCKSSEGITLISFVAAVIYIVISSENIKNIVIRLVGVILSFVLTITFITGVYNILDVADFSLKDRYEFPLTHWIMMGLGETGEYCEADYQATVSLESKQEKLEMHKTEIANRLSSRTLSEWTEFLKTKQKVAWVGGTYGAATAFPDNYAYNFAYRFILVLSILSGAVFDLISYIKNKKQKITFLAFSQIYTMGVFLFFCIWEVSPSYLFSSIPMLILCSVLSIHNITETITNKKVKKYEQNI